mgnify:CR=1 FL=1
MAEHRVRIVAWTALLTLPLAGLSILLAAPEADLQLVGEVENYEDTYLLCYIRGPEGIIIELAERLG